MIIDPNGKQARIVEFLREWEQPYPPSVREIQAGARITSTSVTKYHLDKLEAEGVILPRPPLVARCVVLAERY